MKKNAANKRTPTVPTPARAALAVSAILALILLLLPEYVPGQEYRTETAQGDGDTAGTTAMSTPEPVPAGTSLWTMSSTIWIPTPGMTTSGTDRPNPFIAQTPVETARSTQPAGTTPAVTPPPSSSSAAAVILPTTPAQPRYASESRFFLSRLPFLEETLRKSRFFTGIYEVDVANPTRMVVLSGTPDRASNLDGFFRIAVDLDGEAWGSSPLALGISRLYTEGGRDRAYADGSFCSDNLDQLMDDALQAILGGGYEPGITGFILGEYRKGMAVRVQSGGALRPASKEVASFKWLDVAFTDGFATYVEFYPNPEVTKAG